MFRHISNKYRIFSFTILTFFIFTKLSLFHYFCFGIGETNLLKHPLALVYTFLPKLSTALLLSSFLFLTKRNYWTILLLCFIDIWIISNLVYYRSYELFLDYDVIAMAGNMEGFWNAVLLYFNWKTWIFLLITILYCICTFFTNKIQNQNVGTSKLWFCIILFVSLSCDCIERYMHRWQDLSTKNIIIPFQHFCSRSEDFFLFKPRSATYIKYVENYTIIDYLSTISYTWITDKIKQRNFLNIKLSPIEEEEVHHFIQKKENKPIEPQHSLIIFLVESFESWLLSDTICGQTILPNINDFQKSYPTLYCHNIRSQVKFGNSADGQMIVNTGLLPISHSSASMICGGNRYPNFANFYKISEIINPGGRHTWNQDVTTYSYEYKKHNFQIEHNDLDVIRTLNQNLDSIKKEKFCIMAITVSTHSPFTLHKPHNLNFPKEIPENLNNYLNSFYYMDSCFGIFLQKFKDDEYLRNNTTIVITGDHNIFRKNMLDEFQPVVSKYNIHLPKQETTIPLIIYSPQIKENITITDTCLQMDIYPTILHLINEEKYWWKGFGVNLLDSIQRKNRPISTNRAYDLSDKIIRSNYFYKEGL